MVSCSWCLAVLVPLRLGCDKLNEEALVYKMDGWKFRRDRDQKEIRERIERDKRQKRERKTKRDKRETKETRKRLE